MPRGFGISNYMTLNFGRGHPAPPWETWASEMRSQMKTPIPVLRLTQNIEEYEAKNRKPAPPGLVIAWAKVQGLDPNPEQVQALLNARKEWRGRKAIPEPGEGYYLELSIVPPKAGGVFPEGGNFKAGKIVELVAMPNEGYKFDHWSGDISGTTSPTEVTMDSDKKITAQFKKVGP